MKTIWIIVIIGVLFVIIFGGLGVFYYVNNPTEFPNPAACTLEAKICPDGSSVGRVLPDCEFEECPIASGNNSCMELGCPKKDVYVGSKDSDKYYECRCSWAKNILPENLVCFSNDEEATEDNRTKSEC